MGLLKELKRNEVAKYSMIMRNIKYLEVWDHEL